MVNVPQNRISGSSTLRFGTLHNKHLSVAAVTGAAVKPLSQLVAIPDVQPSLVLLSFMMTLM